MSRKQNNQWATMYYHMAHVQFKDITYRKEGCVGHHHTIKR